MEANDFVNLHWWFRRLFFLQAQIVFDHALLAAVIISGRKATDSNTYVLSKQKEADELGISIEELFERENLQIICRLLEAGAHHHDYSGESYDSLRDFEKPFYHAVRSSPMSIVKVLLEHKQTSWWDRLYECKVEQKHVRLCIENDRPDIAKLIWDDKRLTDFLKITDPSLSTITPEVNIPMQSFVIVPHVSHLATDGTVDVGATRRSLGHSVMTCH